jgi:hypothetical protein
MDWLRQNGNKLDDPTYFGAICNVAGILSPLPTASTAHKKKAPASALNWIRNNDPGEFDNRFSTINHYRSFWGKNDP